MIHVFTFLFSLNVFAGFEDIVCRVTAPSGEFMGQYLAGQYSDGSPALLFQASSKLNGGKWDNFVAIAQNAVQSEIADMTYSLRRAGMYVELDCEREHSDFPFLHFYSKWENFEAQLRLHGEGCEAVCRYSKANGDYRKLIVFSGYQMMYQPYPGDVPERIFAGDVPRAYDTKDSVDRNFSTHIKTYVTKTH